MTSSHKKANRLIQSTSPYLLQHAYNPVDWFEWGTEALNKAKQENKPILVSIGYSSCHWCHVMERESFEVEDIAQIMNEHFVCIKVDREERPDIDQIYMEAVQAMGINGGWPLNVFLTPDQKPFYGGTYFPPKNWAQLLIQLNKTFELKRDEINASANELSQHIQVSDLKRFSITSESTMEVNDLDAMFKILERRFDTIWGGIEKAPKFIMPTIWQFLLRYHHLTDNQRALEMVKLTLTKISQGGIYDQLGGGFSRYSVDGEWFAPHFEKMLYDNAQLLSLYSEAYAVTKNQRFKNVVYETVEWVKREMSHPEGGFYSALDADSEGVEGKFYSWTYSELEAVLQKDTKRVAEYYHATQEGNWEHGMNILFLNETDDTSVDFKNFINSKKKQLLATRSTRIRPGLDDKILTGWNAMTIKGLVDAYNFFGEKKFLDLAVSAMDFLEKNLITKEHIYRAFKNKRSDTKGFLEDYAFVIQAYYSLYQSTFNEKFIHQAEHWCDYSLTHFFDETEGFFHFTDNSAEKLIARKKEVFDNVIASSNSVMAQNLYHLGIALDRDEWKVIAVRMVSVLSTIIKSEPGYTSNWGILMTEMIAGTSEVAIVGNDCEAARKELSKHFLPFSSLLGSIAQSQLPLLKERTALNNQTTLYVCRDKTCQLPVHSVEDALAQLRMRP
jgi:uncharacterized protein